ncbi:hypothetical protein [Microbulbifer aestuariivivens]
MSIDRNGAVTQSEKVRELIAMARESVGTQSFCRAYIASAEAILPFKARYMEEDQRSLLVEALLELLAEGAAAIQGCAAEKPMAPVLEKKTLSTMEAFLEKILLVTTQENPRMANPDSATRIKKHLDSLLNK